MKARTYIVFLLLRLGLAFPLLFAAVVAFYNPLIWVDYIPDTVSFLPVNEITVIYLLGLIDAFLGLWILWGRRLFFFLIRFISWLFFVILPHSVSRSFWLSGHMSREASYLPSE